MPEPSKKENIAWGALKDIPVQELKVLMLYITAVIKWREQPELYLEPIVGIRNNTITFTYIGGDH